MPSPTGSRLRPIPGLALLSALELDVQRPQATALPPAIDHSVHALVRTRCQLAFEVLIRARSASLIHWPTYGPFIKKVVTAGKLAHPAGPAIDITTISPQVRERFAVRIIDFSGTFRTGAHGYGFLGKIVGKTLVELEII